MKRGPYKNREAQHAEARELRAAGLGYRTIASCVGVHWRTIKGWVEDIEIDGDAAHAIHSRLSRRALGDLKQKGSIRRRLLEERGDRCERCGIDEWCGEPITIEMDHIDGNNKNHAEENLRLLCPNCHSQTPTWRNKNRARVEELEDSAVSETAA